MNSCPVKGRFPRIRVRLSAALLFLFWIAVDRSVISLLPIAAAVLHECGHIAAMTALGMPVGEIEISVFGAEIKSLMLNGAGAIKRCLVYLAGPLTNIISGLLTLGAEDMTFAVCSFALAAVNLLPIRTLDGGCALFAALSRFRCADRVLDITSGVGVFTLWLAAVYFLLLCGGNLSLLAFVFCLFAELYLT